MFREIIKLSLSLGGAGEEGANRRDLSKLLATLRWKNASFKTLKVEKATRTHRGIAGKLSSPPFHVYFMGTFRG